MSLSGGPGTLRFAVRPTIVAHYAGQLLLVLAALTLVPTAVAFGAGDTGIGLRYLLTIGLYLAIGGPCARCRAQGKILQGNEAMVITALMFAVPPFFLTIPFTGYGLSFADALFEGVSGFTTTGLSTLATVGHMPPTFYFSRAWTQWIGGLGVVVLSLAMLLETGSAAQKLGFEPRATDDIAGGTHSHARKMIVVYLALTVVGALGIWAATGRPYDALVHALAAVSTGGFSSHDDSLAGLGGFWARFAVTALSFAGALSFYVYYQGYYGKWTGILKDSQTRGIAIACLVAGLLVYACLSVAGIGPDPVHRLETALFMSVSAQTTAGFSTVPVTSLDPASQLVLIAAMFIGGGLGSTAGGIKMFRLLVMVQLFRALLLRASAPSRAFVPVSLDGTAIESREIEATLAAVLGAAGAILVSWLLFLAFGEAPLASLFDVTSAIGTVGLSAGTVGPGLALPLKLLLCFDMVLGRVETVALIVLLLPGTWIGRRRTQG